MLDPHTDIASQPEESIVTGVARYFDWSEFH